VTRGYDRDAVTDDTSPADRAVSLRDGAQILLRPITGDDKGLLEEAFAHLGPDSRYRRFLAVHDRLTARELQYFTEVDHVHHDAIVAIDASSGHGIGVARYIATRDDPQAAEVAFTVVDEWQGRGVGSALLHALVDRARANGIRRFVATVLSENTPMLELLHELDGVHLTNQEGGVSEFAVELPDQGPGPLAAVLRHAAARSRPAPEAG
jgi:GNAT superfamily N-acetyltransferase